MHTEVKTKEEFEVAIATGKVLVDFWAPWCGPCQMMGERIASEIEVATSDIKVVKINVDEAPELAAMFGVMSIPTLLCFRDSRQVAQFVGVTATSEIVSSFR